MLDVFRKKGLSTVIYGVIIVGMVLVFVIQFNPSAGKKAASIKQACVGSVRGWCIDPKDHQAAYRMLAPRDGRTLSASQIAQVKQFALDGLIERELLIHEAERLGVTVSENEVTDAIFEGEIHVSIPASDPSKAAQMGAGGESGVRFANFRDSKTKIFDVKVYERTIKNLVGRSPTEFREEQGREILASKMRDLVRTPVRVSDPEAEDRYIAEKSQAQVESWVFQSAYFGRWGVPVSDAIVADYMKDTVHQGEADSLVETRKKDSLPVENHIRHILINLPKPSDKSAGNEASDGDVKAKALAHARISLAMARIKAGEAFADVARDMSEDKGSALRGGDVGDKTDGFVPEFKDAANALKPGEMTPEAIETQFGYHLIERDDPGQSAAVEAALKKDAAKDVYLKAKSVNAANDAAKAFSAAVKAGKTADAALLDMEQGLVAANKAKPYPLIGIKARVVPADATATDATGAADAGGATMSLASSADAGTNAHMAKPATPAAAGTSGVSFDATTDPQRPTTDTSASFNKTGEAFPNLSGDAAERVNAFAFAAKEGELNAEPMKTDEGFVVLRVKQQKPATKDEFAKDRVTYVASLLQLKRAEELATYVKRLRDAAKADIKTDDSYIHPVLPDGGVAPESDDEEQP